MKAATWRPALHRAGVACVLMLAYCASAPANTLSGTVRYQDKQFSTVDGSLTATPMQPARYITLDFVRAANLGTVLGTTTTDANGNFTSPNIGTPADLVVLVKATGTYQNQTVVVRDQSLGGGAIQTFQSAQFDLSAGNLAGQAIDIVNDDISGAFNIYDCTIQAHTFIREQFFATPPVVNPFTLTVRWEDGKDSETGVPSTSYFTVVNGQLFLNVLGDTGVDNDAFDDSVLLHEYGHVAAFLYSKDDSPAGSHNLGEALDLRLAFSEGWADFFSCAVRGVQWYVDTNAAIPLIFEIATPAVTGAPGTVVTGPDNEMAVCAILWDILNSAITINNGAVNTPREALWDVIDNYLPSNTVTDVCLEDLWDGFFESGVTPAYGAGANKTPLNNLINANGVSYFVDTLEPNATAATAKGIFADGSTISCTHYYDSNGDGLGQGDQDWFSFDAEKDKTYTIQTSNLGNAADTVLQLYDTDAGTLLATNDNITAANLASRIVFTAPTDGKYYVRITRSTAPLPIVDPPPDDPDPAHGTRAYYGTYDLTCSEGGTAGGPVVAIINPYDGAVDVAINVAIIATFSQPVKQASVTTNSFTVSTGGVNLPGTVALDVSRTIATFTPNTGLLNNTQYTINLTNTIVDDQDRTLTPFTSTFTTVDGAAPPPGPVPRVPRAQIASGSGYVEVEWVYPAGNHDGVIVAAGTTRFPTVQVLDQNGTPNLVVQNGTEVFRGTTDTSKQIQGLAHSQRAFVVIWTFIGTQVSEPYYLASRASRGGQGIIEPLNAAAAGPQPGGPTLPKPARLQAVSGDGFVDVEWVVAAGTFDGVIVGTGARRFPKLEQVVENGALTLKVSSGTELYRANDKVRFRLSTANSVKRLLCIWTFKGTEYSRPLYASTRASKGGKGLSEEKSFYGQNFEEPESLN